MKKIASYPISVVYFLLFGLTLVIFDVIQRICFLFGYYSHKKSVDFLNFFLVSCTRVLGTTYKITDNCEVPKNSPVLIVSNHQSMYDIPPIIWWLRRYHPKFVSKKSLGKGVPSISYNLNKGGSILIDRKNKVESLHKMNEFTKYLMNNKRGGVIFPEGTRGRDGEMKEFKPAGLTMLIENMKGAYIVPVSVSNSWKLQRGKPFPMPLFTKVKIKVHQGIQIENQDINQLIKEVEGIVKSGIEND